MLTTPTSRPHLPQRAAGAATLAHQRRRSVDLGIGIDHRQLPAARFRGPGLSRPCCRPGHARQCRGRSGSRPSGRRRAPRGHRRRSSASARRPRPPAGRPGMVRGSRFMISATVMDTDSSLLSPACPSGELPTHWPAGYTATGGERNRTGPGRRPRALRRCSSWGSGADSTGDRALAVALGPRAAPRRTPACGARGQPGGPPRRPGCGRLGATSPPGRGRTPPRVSGPARRHQGRLGVREAPWRTSGPSSPPWPRTARRSTSSSGTRGEGPLHALSRLLRPSVSHGVIGHQHRPILVVPAADINAEQ